MKEINIARLKYIQYTIGVFSNYNSDDIPDDVENALWKFSKYITKVIDDMGYHSGLIMLEQNMMDNDKHTVSEYNKELREIFSERDINPKYGKPIFYIEDDDDNW